MLRLGDRLVAQTLFQSAALGIVSLIEDWISARMSSKGLNASPASSISVRPLWLNPSCGR